MFINRRQTCVWLLYRQRKAVTNPSKGGRGVPVSPVLTVPQVRFFMERFINGDINDLKYRRALVDTFVRKIVLFDDKLTILYNVQDGQSAVSFDNDCLSNGTMVEISGFEPLTSTLRT